MVIPGDTIVAVHVSSVTANDVVSGDLSYIADRALRGKLLRII